MAHPNQNQIILYSIFVIVIALILAPSLGITGKAVLTNVSGENSNGKYLVVLDDKPILEQRAKLDTELEAMKTKEQTVSETGNIFTKFIVKADNAIKRRIVSSVRDSYTAKVNKTHEQFKKEIERKGIDVAVVQEYQYAANALLVEGASDQVEQIATVASVNEVMSFESVQTQPENAVYAEFFYPEAVTNENSALYTTAPDTGQVLFASQSVSGEIVCEDGTKKYECSPTKPKECMALSPEITYYINNCLMCGCPDGYYCAKSYTGESKCALNGEVPYTCSDGTLDGGCSATSKGKKCIAGKLVNDCKSCGCLEGLSCTGDYSCKSVTIPTTGTCSVDGTPANQCSTVSVGKKCVYDTFWAKFTLLSDCKTCGCAAGYVCGCPVGQQCDPFYKDTCYSERTSCTETDNGDPYVAGTISAIYGRDGSSWSFSDVCMPTNPDMPTSLYLSEYTCNVVKDFPGHRVQTVYCPYGCSNGACLKGSANQTTPTPVPTPIPSANQTTLTPTPTPPTNQTNTCSDTDNGNNPYVQGTVTTNDGKYTLTYTDGCGSASPNTLTEYTCSNGVDPANFCNDKTCQSFITCQYGCVDGACRTEAAPTVSYPVIPGLTVLWSDDFNDLSNWIKTGTDTMEIVNGELHIKTTQNRAQLTTNNKMASFDMSKDYVIKTRFKFQSGHWLFIAYNKQVNVVYDNANNGLICRYGSTNSIIQTTINPGQWYEIEIRVRPSTNTYDVYVDHTLKKTCKSPTDRTTNEFLIGDFETGTANFGEIYYDYFELSSVLTSPPVNQTTYTCSDGTPYGNCSATTPKYCSAGTLINKCSQCGCSYGTCMADGMCLDLQPPNQTYTCSDGTTLMDCSANKPYYCTSSKTLVQDCNKCPCPSTAPFCNTATGTCYSTIPPTQKCSDGTQYGNCSATKPMYCENGSLISKCTKCGCSSTLTCKVADGTCIVPEPTPTPPPTEPPATNVFWREDFNDLSSWVKTGTDTTEIVSGQVHISTTSNRAQLTTNNKMAGLDVTKDYTIKTRAKVARSSHWLFYAYNKHINLVYDYSTLTCRYGTTNTQIMPITIGQWYDLEARVHPSTNKYDVYVNGVFKKTCSMPTDRTTYEFLIGDFETGTANYGEMYFDYFEVSTSAATPSPTPTPPTNQTQPPVAQTCADGTTYGNCSATKPFYCDNGNLVQKCSACGCSSNRTCSTDATCKLTDVPNVCTDSDGSNIYTKGYVEGWYTTESQGLDPEVSHSKVTYKVYDECNGANTQVNEMWCYDHWAGEGQVNGRMVYNCPYGCLDGACINGTS